MVNNGLGRREQEVQDLLSLFLTFSGLIKFTCLMVSITNRLANQTDTDCIVKDAS